MVELMCQEYDLGFVYFIYDIIFVFLNSGVFFGYFFNDDLEIDFEIICLEDFLIGQVGYMDVVIIVCVEVLMFIDCEQFFLLVFFLNVIIFNNLGYVFNKMFVLDMVDCC